MDFTALLEEIPSKEACDLIARLVVEQPHHFPVLWEFSISAHKYAWRGSWVVDHINDKAPEMVAPYIPKMIEIVPALKSDGQKRHLLKIISMHPLSEDLPGDFVDFCFSILESPKEAIAVRAHAMQILYNLTQQVPDFGNELALVIEAQLDDASVGLRNKGKKLLGKLSRF